ncbi:hypothetical protein NQD34_007856, partial [Periophthalmus magnuspinnatus]
QNRSRRQNIRIVGVEEGADANNTVPVSFVAKFLMEMLGEENFDRAIVIDRAHRSRPQRPQSPHNGRVIKAQLHCYSDKEKVMSLSRAKGHLLFKGSPVHIFPDVSPEVGRQRAAFNKVKAKFFSSGVRYSMAFPARLVVTMDGTRHTFNDPQSAEKFIQ